MSICLPTCVRPTPSQAHCPSCHETFGGVRGFDLHREGTVYDRSCLSPEAVGLVKDDRGVWVRPVGATATNWAARRAAEQAEVHTPGTPS